jgi:hypothetical protein
MKPVVCSIAMLMFSLSLAAQESPVWRLGASGLLGKSKFTYVDAPSEYSPGVAYQFGIFGQYARRKTIAFRLGLGYAHSKGGYNGETPPITFPGFPDIPGDPYKANFEYTHITVPMEMLINFGKDADNGFYVLFGPALQFQESRQAERTEYLFSQSVTSQISTTADRKIDLLGQVGMGYAFRLGSGLQTFIQPTISTNLPGNILDSLNQEKGVIDENITYYGFGVAVGLSYRM